MFSDVCCLRLTSLNIHIKKTKTDKKKTQNVSTKILFMRNIQQFIFNIYDAFAIEIAFKLLDILFIY